MNKSADAIRSVIVFVHGFGSDEQCWDKLIELFQIDEEVKARFDFVRFSYPTAWVNLKLNNRIPDHKEIANYFNAVLDSKRFDDREIILVGHSQGGLIIHAYLAYMLNNDGGEQLEQIRQVITLATPHSGSLKAFGVRKFLSRFIKNPQDQRLWPLDQDTADAVRTVKDRIATTPLADRRHWPIPIYCFGGLSDKVVPPASAQGLFSDDNFKMIPGDHSGILNPESRDDDRYREFKEVLLDPIGHPYVFEIEHYHTHIKVQPIERQTFTISLEEGRTRQIETDNICELKRTVHFARNNRCQNEFKIRYLASDNSCFIPEKSHKTAESQLDSEYKKAGEKIDFLFIPKYKRPDKEEYYLYLKIFNGYGEGRRDVHFHLGHRSMGARANYRKLTYTLDLSEYLAAGFKMESPPAFYLHPNDPGVCSECKQNRKHAEEILPSQVNRAGEWTWEFNNVRQGVTDILWDFEK